MENAHALAQYWASFLLGESTYKKKKSTEIPYLGGAEGRADGHDDAPDNADVTMHLIVEVVEV
jgi:hypothetical protein